MYACPKHELEGHIILSEYAHDSSGRVNFYLPDHDSGLELLQTGSPSKTKEHADRFLLYGKYGAWEIMKHHIIINFCFNAYHHDVRLTGQGDGKILSNCTANVPLDLHDEPEPFAKIFQSSILRKHNP